MNFDEFFQVLGSYGDRSFPDAAFIVEVGAEKDKNGKTLQKYRHLPHHTKNAKSPTENSSVDIPHLRNALARVGQVSPVKEGSQKFRKRALSHLQAHARKLLDTYKSKASLSPEEKDFIVFYKSFEEK